MKGQNKEFNKYLDYELNDYYLEPLENSKASNLDISSKISQKDKLIKHIQSYQQIKQTLINKNSNSAINPKYDPLKVPSQSIYDFAIQPEKDVPISANNTQDFHLKKSLLIEESRKFYSAFQKQPLFCLSFSLAKEIILWKGSQVNLGAQDFLSSDMKALAKPHLQAMFYSLPKILFPQSEKIVDIRFLGSTWFYIASKQGEVEFYLKFYNVELFQFAMTSHIGIARHNIRPLDLFTFQLVIRNFKTLDTTQDFFQTTLWKNVSVIKLESEMKANPVQTSTLSSQIGQKLTKEVEKVTEKIHKGAHYPTSLKKQDLPYITKSSNGVVLLIDRDNSNYIAWKEDSLLVSSLNIGVLKSIHQIGTCIYFKNEQGSDFELSLEEFPIAKMDQKLISSEVQNTIGELHKDGVTHQKILNIISDPAYLRIPYSSALYYQYPLEEKIVTSSKKENIKVNEEIVQNTQKSENIFEKISRIKKENKNLKNDDAQKDMLKELRADISSKVQEVRKFKEDFAKEQKKWRPEEINEPGGVQKEELELYEKIRTEKKKLAKEREKKKAQKKNALSKKIEV